jgi:hypothetical protein
MGMERPRSRPSSVRVRIRRGKLSPRPQSREQANPIRRRPDGSPARPSSRDESGPCSVVVLSSETASRSRLRRRRGDRYGFDREPLDGLNQSRDSRRPFTCFNVHYQRCWEPLASLGARTRDHGRAGQRPLSRGGSGCREGRSRSGFGTIEPNRFRGRRTAVDRGVLALGLLVTFGSCAAIGDSRSSQ